MAIRYQRNDLLTYDEWLLARLNTIGASEVSTVCFGSTWTSNLELWYQKIGIPKPTLENLRMYIGKVTEDTSAHLWEHYNGSEQSIVENVRKKTPVKKCVDLKVTIFNDKYPHLSVTPDREIQDFGVYAGKGKGYLEIKNTQSYVLNSYQDGLPLENVIQLITQLMVGELDYGELFYFVDNMRCECHPMLRKNAKKHEQIILDRTIPFWESVLKARPIYNAMYEANRNTNMRMVAECQRELASLEPPVQHTEGYNNFLSQKYKDRLSGIGIIKGADEHLKAAKKHKDLAAKIKKFEEEQLKIEIELKNTIGDNSSLSFGTAGEISWRENKSGKRIFLNKVK